MNERIYSTFDSVSIGPQLSITQGNLLLQTAISCDNARMARSTYATSDPRYAQFLIYSPDGTNPALTSKACMIGICTAAANLGGYVGSDSEGYGFSPGDGKLYCNGSSVATGTAATYGDTITVAIDPQASIITIKNGNATVIEYVLPSVQAWYFGATVSGDPGAMALQSYTGASPMPYPVTALDGWWAPRTTIEPIYLSTEPYISLPDDTLAHQKFNGDIDRQSPVSISRAVKFWPWGASMPPALASGSMIQMDILDPNHAYDALLTEDVRDLPVTFSRLPQGESLDDAEQVFDAYIDHVEPLTDQTKRLTLKGKLVLSQSQLRRPIFPPTVDPGVAGKPRPMSIGVCGPYAPELYNADSFQYGCSDAPIAAFGEVRIQGIPQVYGGTFAVTADGEGIQFNDAPAGAITVRSTDFGGVFDSTSSDALGGEGDFTSASKQSGGTPDRTGQPVGWNGDGGYYGQDAKTTVFQVSGSSPNKIVSQPNQADAVYTLADTSSFRILNGRSYAYAITCTSVPSYGDGTDPVTGDPKYALPAQLAIGWLPRDGNHSNIAFFNHTKFRIPTATTYTGVFTNTTGIDQPFVLGFLCNDRIYPGGGTLSISKIILNLLPPVGQQTALAGPGLDDMLKALLVARGPYDSSEYDSTGAQAIDTATGYIYGLHFGSGETPTVESAYRPVLDSPTADVFEDRAGDIQTMRLFAPESYSGSVAGSLTVTDFASYLLPYPDNAENLTSRFSGGKNYAPSSDADFQNIDVSQVSLAERKALQQPYAWTVTGGGQLSPRYAAANTANPLGTCFDLQADGQAEADRVTAIYSVPRNFYVGDVFTPIGREIEIGDVWNVTYPTGSLVSGQKLLVVGVNERPSDEITTVIFWGL